MDEVKLDKEKLRGIGTDGASTMIGCHNGVVARLKALTPSAIGVHCAAHRLNLASVQAGDSIPYIKRFTSIVRQLYDYFQNSTVRMAGLKAIQTLIHERGKLCAPSSTRWLSVEHSVKRLKECFCSVVMSLQREGEERGDAKALGLHKLVTEYRFVCTMLLMCDVLPHVSHLSKCFQISDCDYSIIPRMLSSTIISLKQLKTSNGMNLSSLNDYMDVLAEANIEIKKPAKLGSDYFRQSIQQPFLNNLITNLEKRFDDKSVIAAFDIFNPEKIPLVPDSTDREGVDKFLKYGNKEISELSNQFVDVLGSEEDCLHEWSSYRQFLRESCTNCKHREVISGLCTNRTTSGIFPIMTKIAKICRVIPIHTADVERTFSQLNLIKTCTRNRLQEKSLDSLLRISIEGPPVEEFPASEAVELWSRKKTGDYHCN